MIRAISIAAALAFATPALAVPMPQTAPPVAEAKSPEEIAFEARAEAFEAQMTQMQSEVETAIRSVDGDEAAGMARIDAILARYQPDIASFLDDFDRFIDTQATAETDDTTRQALAGARTGVRQALEALPGQIRAGARSAISAQPPAA